MYGCHISVEKTLFETYESAQKAGCKAFQIFWGGNVTFKRRPIDMEDIEKIKKHGLDEKIHMAIHAPYVYSLVKNFERTKPSLTQELKLVSMLKNSAVVVHTGSYKDLCTLPDAIKIVAKNIRSLYDSCPTLGTLLLENTAGQKMMLPETLDTYSEIFKLVNNPKVGYCLDTCHSFNSGLVDLRDPHDIDRFYNALEKTIGLEKLGFIHVNDSRYVYNSKKDGHALLRKGFIWEKYPEALSYFLHKFSKFPMVAETANWIWDRKVIREALLPKFTVDNIKNACSTVQMKSKGIYEGLGKIAQKFITDLGNDLRKHKKDITIEEIMKEIKESKKYKFLEKYNEELKLCISEISENENPAILQEDSKETEPESVKKQENLEEENTKNLKIEPNLHLKAPYKVIKKAIKINAAEPDKNVIKKSHKVHKNQAKINSN